MDVNKSNKEYFIKNIDNYNKEEILSKTEERVLKNISSKKYKKVLDIGCGCGRTTVKLKKRGFDVIGIDYVKEYIDVAKRKSPDIKYRVMDALKLDKHFKAESFDFVLFSFNGLDGIYPHNKRKIVLKQIKKILRKGGIFLYQSHNSWFIGPSRKYWIRLGKEKMDRKYYFSEKNKKNDEIICFYQNPLAQMKILNNMGFKHIKMIGALPFPNFLNYFIDYAPIYICKK